MSSFYIAKMDVAGNGRRIFCKSNGDIKIAGPKLINHYSHPDILSSLIDLGSLQSLGITFDNNEAHTDHNPHQKTVPYFDEDDHNNNWEDDRPKDFSGGLSHLESYLGDRIHFIYVHTAIGWLVQGSEYHKNSFYDNEPKGSDYPGWSPLGQVLTSKPAPSEDKDVKDKTKPKVFMSRKKYDFMIREALYNMGSPMSGLRNGQSQLEHYHQRFLANPNFDELKKILGLSSQFMKDLDELIEREKQVWETIDKVELI